MNHVFGSTGTFGRSTPRSTLEQLRAALEDTDRKRPTSLKVACVCGPVELEVSPRDTAETLLAALIAARTSRLPGCTHVDE